jgi:hypothetical protein
VLTINGHSCGYAVAALSQQANNPSAETSLDAPTE